MSFSTQTPVTIRPEITLEGFNISDISSFYTEINTVFMKEEDWQIGESLDAFDDLLYGNFGLLRGAQEVDLVWENIDHSRECLGFEATRNYYLNKLKPESPFNKKFHQEQLEKLEQGTGKTYFDIIIEIIASHPNIRLVAKNS
ncbi:ribonuclease inhibitor [Pedobacter sp. AW1-32]|uniref:ribonuclease inhibitor n=1 Tax=Pedobacter sp. AW1-32 TaxID=3383026 RepID=UPI003FED689A